LDRGGGSVAMMTKDKTIKLNAKGFVAL